MSKEKKVSLSSIVIAIVTSLLIVIAPLKATASTFQQGDIFEGGGDSKIYQYRNGNLISTLNTNAGVQHYVEGLCFSTNGNYLFAISTYATGSQISRFDSQGALIDGIWGGNTTSQADHYTFESCVVDAYGNVYIGEGVITGAVERPRIRKIGPDGNLVGYFNPDTDEHSFTSIDLDLDQCTLVYTSKGIIKRFDVCNNRQVADLIDLSTHPLSNGSCTAVRIRNNHEVLAACSNIFRLHANGQIIKTYEAAYYQPDRCGESTQPSCEPFGLVNLASDPAAFWAAITRLVNRIININIKTGQLLTYYNIQPSAGGLAIYRAQTAAATECADGLDNDGDGLIDYPDDDLCFDPKDNSEAMKCVAVFGRSFCLSPTIEKVFYGLAIVLILLVGRSIWKKRN